MKILLSPCLYCANENEYHIEYLQEILEFIEKYIDGCLDIYDDAFYNIEKISAPPFIEYNRYWEYAKVVDLLQKLQIGGELVDILQHGLNFSVLCEKYKIINQNEFQILIDYLYTTSPNNYLLFLGIPNWDVTDNIIHINISDKSLDIKLVRNPLLEESSNYNSYLKTNNSDEIFVNKDLCKQLVKQMNEESKNLSILKGSLYKRYGEIIALRNNFDVYPVQSTYNPDTDYYKRKDGKFIISVDLIHGHFEVFHGSGKKLWFAEYSFDGEKLYAPIGKELREMQQTHKL